MADVELSSRGSVIKTAYEGVANTNAFTDAEKTLLGNQSGANTGDMSDADVKTAYENNADSNEFSDAEQTLLGNQSGTNTGDEAASSATVAGVVELATIAEVDTGTDTGRAITPAGLAGSALQATADSAAQLNAAQEYTKTQNFNATTLTDAANISWDLESNQVAKVTLTDNRTLDNPTNMVDGATYILRVIQDAGGTNTLAYGNAYLWPGGTAPVITATGDAIDIITFVSDGTNMFGVISQDFS
jgi:hypothetical protein